MLVTPNTTCVFFSLGIFQNVAMSFSKSPFLTFVVILGPIASGVGLGAAALEPLCVDPRGSAAEFREATACAQESQTLQLLMEKDVHF